MKEKIIWVICLCIGSAAFAQQTKNWKLDSYQFNLGGVMSTKIPAASYDVYDNIIATSLGTGLWNYNYTWSEPKSLTNLRMRPLYNANVQFYNSKTSAIQRFGFTLNSRMLSSFLTHYDALTPSNSIVLGDLRLDHVSPVLTLDYAYLKQINVNHKLHFNYGAGAYAGMSLWNQISIEASRQYDLDGAIYSGGGLVLSDVNFENPWLSSFTKHNFNAGIYASFGLEYSLHDKQIENQRWYLTYENRICYDFFAVKNVPSSWFSFQSAQMFGVKYYLNRK
jgi:hypothetical protein